MRLDSPELAAATHLHQTLNAPSHPIRNRLLRLTADSPDLLAIIKQEGTTLPQCNQSTA